LILLKPGIAIVQTIPLILNWTCGTTFPWETNARFIVAAKLPRILVRQGIRLCAVELEISERTSLLHVVVDAAPVAAKQSGDIDVRLAEAPVENRLVGSGAVFTLALDNVADFHVTKSNSLPEVP